MSELTNHQFKRIRRARSADIGRIVDQERYWSSEALRAILRRIEQLNQVDPTEALKAGLSARKLVERVRDATPDLYALTAAVYGSTLRHNCKLEEALATYRQALNLKGLSNAGRGDVFVRMAVTQVALGQLREGLITVNEALTLLPDPVPAFAVRALVYQDLGRLEEALADCMTIFERVRHHPRSDYSLLSAIATSCNVLSFETGLNAEPVVFAQLEEIIEEYRRQYPNNGSSFYKVQRPRLMLSRARALIMMRTGRARQAIVPLQRAARGLAKNYPDDALAATLDLVCAYAQSDLYDKAAITIKGAPKLLENVRFGVRPLAENALKVAVQKKEVRYGEAVELRSMLRPQERK